MEKISIEDLAEGDIVEFYDNGFRFSKIKNIKKIRKTNSYIIETETYGKVEFEKIKNVLVYKDDKLVKKILKSDIFE